MASREKQSEMLEKRGGLVEVPKTRSRHSADERNVRCSLRASLQGSQRWDIGYSAASNALVKVVDFVYTIIQECQGKALAVDPI